MLGHRLRRWPNIKTTLAQRLVFAGLGPTYIDFTQTYHVMYQNTVDMVIFAKFLFSRI